MKPIYFYAPNRRAAQYRYEKQKRWWKERGRKVEGKLKLAKKQIPDKAGTGWKRWEIS